MRGEILTSDRTFDFAANSDYDPDPGNVYRNVYYCDIGGKILCDQLCLGGD